MQKVQRPWPEVADDLNEHLRQCDLNNVELSKASHINYHAVRRLRLSGARNQSGNALRLCTFFKISLTMTVKPQSDEFGKMVAELGIAWDGSAPHAKLLTKLIRSTKSFRVGDRQGDGSVE